MTSIFLNDIIIIFVLYMKGGTGVFIENINIEENFFEFLENSTIEYLSKGSFGIVFKATIRADSGYVSKYKNIDYSGYGTPVNSLIFKISALSYYTKVPGYTSQQSNTILDQLISPISKEEFIKEVNIQTEVFLKTMNTLQPLCPGIVYSNIHTEPNSSTSSVQTRPTILDLIIQQPASSTDNYMSFFKKAVKEYTVIGMELLDGYETMHSLIQKYPANKQLYESMVVFILIELFLKTGYTHADFHYGNIMIHPTDTSYFKGTTGSVIIIDFGLASKIPLHKLESLRESYEKKEYKKVIQKLCAIPRSDGLYLKQYTNSYKICKNDFTPDDNMITQLFIEKEEATNDIVELFNSKTDERDMYPLLPLSNSIKNKMFPGMIDSHQQTQLEIIHLNLNPNDSIENQKLLTVLNWVCLYCEKYKDLMSIYIDKPFFQCVAHSCYLTCYVILDPTFRPVIYANQLTAMHFAGLIGTYCAGIDKKLNNNLFNTYVDTLKNPKYTTEIIQHFCKKYQEKTQNVRFVAIYDFMTKDDMDHLSRGSIDAIRQILASDLDVYNHPREWVHRRFPKQVIDQEPYVFPFDNNDDNDDTVSGPFGDYSLSINDSNSQFPTSGPFDIHPPKSSLTKDVSIKNAYNPPPTASGPFSMSGPFDIHPDENTATIGGRKLTRGRKLTKRGGRKLTRGRGRKLTKKRRGKVN
jgi:hypothetical protein